MLGDEIPVHGVRGGAHGTHLPHVRSLGRGEASEREAVERRATERGIVEREREMTRRTIKTSHD